jgi:hypothetical protein
MTFCLNGMPFDPIIAETKILYNPSYHNACKLFVDLSLTSSLDFTEVIKKAHLILAEGGKLVWELYLDIKPHLTELHFEGIFNAHYQALKTFSQVVWPLFKDHTLAACLYQGNIDLSAYFSWNAGHYQNFLEWLTDLYKTPSHLFESTELQNLEHFNVYFLDMFEKTPFTRHLKNLYCMNTLIAYLHRLVAALPEELLVFASLDATAYAHPAYLYQLLSKERFSHLHIALKGHLIPLEVFTWKEDTTLFQNKTATVGVCFPNDAYCVQSTLNALKKVFIDLETHQIPYRVIPEFLITSSWDGLDDLIVLQKSLSSQGKRILQGFSITGGRCIYIDNPIGLDPECCFEDYLKGISG